MPKLVKNASKHPRSIAGRFTAAEEKRVQEAADARGMSPAGLARQVILSAVDGPSTETILLEKLCTIEYLLTQFFAGLFTHLSDKDDVITPERFQKVRSLAPAEGRKIADELLNPKPQTGEKNVQ